MTRAETLADDLPFPQFLCGAGDGVILWANQQAQTWLGQSRKGLRDQPFVDWVDVDGFMDALQACRETLASVTLRGVSLAQGGNRSHDLTLFPTGADIGVMIYPLTNANVETEPSEIGAHMSQLIAHELKNPLAGIRGAAQLLRDEIHSEEGRELVGLITTETERVGRLADSLQDIGLDRPADLVPLQVHRLLRHAARVVNAERTDCIEIKTDFDLSLPDVDADADLISQAVLNLLKNAVDATRGQGVLKLRTRFRTGVTRRLEDGRKRSLPVEIIVEDDGPGIPAARQDVIFQPFVSSKASGRGLGLAVVAQIAKAHGGVVELRSRPGRTAFSILLPISGLQP